MMSKYISYEEVPVWKLAHELTLVIYKVTNKFPKQEIFGLITQIRKSSSSIPANIVEGFYRNTTKELLSYLFNARGSCGETLYHLRLASDLKYLSNREYATLKV